VSNFDDRINSIYISELLKIAHDELVSLRIMEIYHLVSTYPFSIQALNELYQCFQTDFNHKRYNQDSQEIDSFDLSNVAYLASYSLSSQAHQRKKLVDAFIENCHRNLLHSGANTVDVINMYNKTIRAFLIIDPKGVLLDKVVRPIRKYLKTRDDVIIKLVHGLLDTNPNTNNLIELAHELRNCGDDLANKTIEDTYGLNWVPDPIDALPDFKKGKVSDIIESLVSIFDSKEVFIDEFNKLFGERLMNVHDYDVSEVKTYIDLLKSRFGKNEFTTLDVMIKDISDSEGINTMLKSTTETTLFHSSIISHNYWSTILDNLGENNEFEVPPQIKKAFENFEHKFSEYKRGRLLKLVPSLGSVKLNLTFKNNVTKSFEVSPVKASVISLFDDEENELSIDTISEKLKMSSYVVTQVLQFWVKEGVLSELTKTLYIVNDELDCENETTNDVLSPELESLPKTSSTKATNNSDYDDILWPYMHSILENFNTISLTRLKELLALTVPKSKFDLSKLEKQAFDGYLDWLLEQGKVGMVKGMYTLKG
jgi:anaphase-promoting complex subunit 2